MLTFSPNQDITITFDMLDPLTGETIEPVSATFSVFDDEGVALTTDQAIAISGGETELNVVISAADNVIAGSEGARTVVLTAVAATGAKELHQTYVLERHAFLVVPGQSGMTLPQAMMLSRHIAQSVIELWPDIEANEQQAALREAWQRLSGIPFKPWGDHDTVPDGVSSDLVLWKTPLTQLTSEQWGQLPTFFKDALKRAQLIEACVILGGDAAWDRRQDGLISKTVGESSEMFVSKKAAQSIISPRAMREIGRYVKRSITIGRA